MTIADYVPTIQQVEPPAAAPERCERCGEVIPPGKNHVDVRGYGQRGASCAVAMKGERRR